MGQPFRAGPDEPYPSAAWFAAADRNGDGRMDETEFVADALAFFAVLDVNKDGVIDSAENRAYEETIAPEILGGDGPGGGPPDRAGGGSRGPRLNMGDGPGDGPGGGMGGGMGGGGHRGPRSGGGGQGLVRSGGVSPLGGAAPYGLLQDPQPVRSADADQSQTVSVAEFKAAALRRFKRLDANGDGALTLAELPLTRVQRPRDR